MRGRYLIGLSNADRRAARVVTGDEVEATDPEKAMAMQRDGEHRAGRVYGRGRGSS